MHVEFEDSIGVYTRFNFDRNTNHFVLFTREQTEMEYCPVLKVIPTYDPVHYNYTIMYNYSCTENSIFQVKVGETRIGWMFPLQALFSSEHDYSDDEHFLKYAYVAYWKLLEDLNITACKTPEEFRLEYYYTDTAMCMLLCDMDNCEAIPEFNVKDYVLNLYKYDYWLTNCIAEKQFLLKQFPQSDRKCIHLKQISLELREERYIQQLFSQQLPTVHDEIIRFYFIYQIIEILIEYVFDHRFKSILPEINADHRNLLDIKDRIQNEATEKHRINLLFREYSQGMDNQYSDELDESCQTLLTYHKQTRKKDVVDNLYAVRCLLVHHLYSLDDKSMEMLEEINRFFLLEMIELLIAYKSPS